MQHFMRALGFITALYFLIQPVKAQWTTLSIGTGEDLESVQLLNTNTIFRGAYAFERSTNGGANFELLPIMVNGVGYLASLHDLHFFDANTGVVIGSFNIGNDGVIFRTTNGGQTWTVAYSFDDGNWPLDLQDLFFVDNSTGWAVGDFGRIFKTTNGGQSWTAQNSGVSFDLSSVHFVNTLTGFAVGNDQLLKTTNGGASWSVTSLSGYPEDLQFVSASIGFIGGDDFLQKTTDGGQSWQNLLVPDQVWIRDLHFFDALNGYLLSNTTVYRTTDGGQKWEASKVTLQNEWAQAFSWLNPNQGIVVGENTLTRITQNGGGVYKPVANFSLPSANYYCDDLPWQLENKTFDFPNYTYQWRINGVLFSTAKAPEIVFPDPETTYAVQLIVSSPTASDTVVQEFTTSPSIDFVLPPIQASSLAVCEGSTVTLTDNLTAGSNLGAFWTLLANGQPTGVSGYFVELNATITINEPTLFTLSGTVSNTCSTVTQSTEILVDIIPLPANPPVWIEKDTVCVGDSTRILFPQSIPGLTYRLDKYDTPFYHSSQTKVGNGDTLVFWSGTTTSLWDFHLHLENGACSREVGAIGSVYAEVVYANMTYTNYTYSVGDTIPFSRFYSAGNDFVWDFGNSATPPSATGPIVSTVFNEPGIYPVHLTAINSAGCTDMAVGYAEIFNKNNLPAIGGTLCYQKETGLEFVDGYLEGVINDVFVASDGSTYLTGYGDSPNLWWFSKNLFFCKYDPDGNLVFKVTTTPASHDGQYFTQFIGTAIAADAEGNIYLGGSFNSDRLVLNGHVIYSAGDYVNKGFILKMDPQGNVLWSAVIHQSGFTPANPTDIIYLNEDRILLLIAGTPNYIFFPGQTLLLDQAPQGFLMLEINADGAPQKVQPLGQSANWGDNPFESTSIVSNGDTSYDHYIAPRMVVNQQGEIVISGEYDASFMVDTLALAPRLGFGRNGFVLTIDQNLKPLRLFSTYAFTNGSSWFGGVLEDDKFPTFAVDAAGDIYQSFCLQPDIIGIYQPENTNTQAFIQDTLPEYGSDGQYLVKYSSEGELLWTLRNGRLFLSNLVVLPDGNVYGLVGYSGTLGLNDRFGQKFGLDAAGQKDVAIVQWSPDGAVLGIQKLAKTSGYDQPEWLASNGCDKLMALFVSAETANASDTFPVFLARVDPYGLCVPGCALSILVQPNNGNFCPNSPAKLGVVAIGNGLSYRWEMQENGLFVPLSDGPDFSGTADAELIISAQSAPALEGKLFRCVVTDQGGGQLITQNVTLEAQALPVIVQQAPALLIGAPFQYFAVHLEAEGMDLAYQWQFLNNGVWTNVLPNLNTYDVKTDSLLIYAQDTSLLSGRQYRCVITNGAGCTVISNTTTVFFGTSSAINPVEKHPSVVYWPNPAGALLNISWTTAPAMVWEWQVCDVTGRVVLEGQAQHSAQTVQLDLQRLLPGTYFLKLIYSKGVLQRSFVKL